MCPAYHLLPIQARFFLAATRLHGGSDCPTHALPPRATLPHPDPHPPTYTVPSLVNSRLMPSLRTGPLKLRHRRCTDRRFLAAEHLRCSALSLNLYFFNIAFLMSHPVFSYSNMVLFIILACLQLVIVVITTFQVSLKTKWMKFVTCSVSD